LHSDLISTTVLPSGNLLVMISTFAIALF